MLLQKSPGRDKLLQHVQGWMVQREADRSGRVEAKKPESPFNEQKPQTGDILIFVVPG